MFADSQYIHRRPLVHILAGVADYTWFTFYTTFKLLIRRGVFPDNMAVSTAPVILRDRVQFTLDAAGEIDTVYGRIDMSDYVNVTEKKGFRISDIVVQFRDPNNAGGDVANTGNWIPFGDSDPTVGSDGRDAWKVTVGSRAYEAMKEVGIGSPDVLHIEEYSCWTYNPAAGEYATEYFHNTYPITMLAPRGYTIVSDLLVGVSVDSSSTNSQWDNGILEIDILVMGKPTTVSQKEMTQLFIQAQDV